MGGGGNARRHAEFGEQLARRRHLLGPAHGMLDASVFQPPRERGVGIVELLSDCDLLDSLFFFGIVFIILLIL